MGEIQDLLGKIGKKPLSSFKLTYDAQTNQIEPVYYWLLDFVKDAGYDVEKLVDNFMASPGSGQFDEIGRKVGTMQEKVSFYLGAINQVVKSILNLIYDLKEFELRLKQYDDLKSKDKDKRQAALMGLKQLWLDNVDIKKGNTAVKALAFSQAPFALLIDAFMVVEDESLKDASGKEIDLNERVKNLLKQKIAEFNVWLKLSEKEIRSRYNIEKSYLRTQVETLKMYTAWVKPYLRNLEQLKQRGFEKDPSLVAAFSTTMFELTFLGKKKVDPMKDSNFRKIFPNYNPKRNYYSCVLISMTYRGHYSQRVSQRGDIGFGFGGRVDMTFDSYALNDDEIKLFNKLREKKEIEDGLSFFQKETEQTLETLKDDINHFLNDDKEEKEDKKKSSSDDINPFSALFSIFSGLFSSNKKTEKKEINDVKDILPDNYIEKIVREKAQKEAKDFLYAVYDIYKKAHLMPSSPESFDY